MRCILVCPDDFLWRLLADSGEPRLDPLYLVESARARTRIVLRGGDVLTGDLERDGLYRRAFQERYDLILTPTAAVPPFPVEWRSGPKEINGQPMPSYIDWAMLTYAFTVVGLPAISVPAGFTKSGLPVGVQIVGRWRDEAGVLRAAAAFESAQPWADRRPPDSES